MSSPETRSPIQLFRIASLLVPSVVALRIAFAADVPTRLTRAVTIGLGPLWVMTAIAFAYRAFDAILAARREQKPMSAVTKEPPFHGPSVLDRIDVLTASGSTLAWSGATAIALSVWVGWASLAILGLVGLGLLHVMVLWTCMRVGADDPWRRRSLTRRFVPDSVLEGDSVHEEIRFDGARIPIGFRLFASGRVGPRWPLHRCVVGADDSDGDVIFESDVGPAFRGEHDAEPLEVWFEDVFGLCRSARFRAGSARLTVLPCARPVEGSRNVRGGDDGEPRAEPRLPSEGSLRLREYQPGDDARRIHWVRSLAAQQVVVRLPDEAPHDRPAVRLVLDTFLSGVDGLTCTSPATLLDGLVEVWLSLGRAFLEAGVRVTMVTAATSDGDAVPFSRRLTAQTLGDALRAGARARWQETVSAGDLAGDERAFVITCRLPKDPAKHASVRWIIVPESLWAPFGEVAPKNVPGFHAHPAGSPDNRGSRRRRERQRWERALRDHATFATIAQDASVPGPESFVFSRAPSALGRAVQSPAFRTSSGTWHPLFVARRAAGRIRLEALS